MEHTRIGIRYPVLLLMALIAGGCGGSSSSSGDSSFTYSTTSAKGDYSEWHLTGSALTATWNVVRSDGGIDYTYNISATCGSPDSFGVRTCTTDSSGCTDGVSACPATSFASTFEMMDVPGVALFVQAGSGGSSELHIGFAKDPSACTQNVSGDYTMIFTGLGLQQNFGMYRSDADFNDVLHSEFGFATPDSNMTQSVVYRTGTESETFGGTTCADGVRTRSIGGGGVLRSMMTAAGLSVVDLPAGQGGLIAFKVANAATLSDFANKSFGGISFPDNADPEIFSATSGPVSADQINVAANGSVSGALSSTIMALGTPATATNPTYPDFTVSPTGYSTSTLAMSYANPAVIPGLFKLDNLSDAGRTIFAGMKFSGKVIGVGMVYNFRTTSEINPSTGTNFTADGLYNTGNFLLFER